MVAGPDVAVISALMIWSHGSSQWVPQGLSGPKSVSKPVSLIGGGRLPETVRRRAQRVGHRSQTRCRGPRRQRPGQQLGRVRSCSPAACERVAQPMWVAVASRMVRTSMHRYPGGRPGRSCLPRVQLAGDHRRCDSGVRSGRHRWPHWSRRLVPGRHLDGGQDHAVESLRLGRNHTHLHP